MKVKINEVFRTVVTNVYDVNPEKYNEWLNGRKSTDNELLEFIYNSIDEPTDYWEDDAEFMSSYVYDADDLHNTVNNE